MAKRHDTHQPLRVVRFSYNYLTAVARWRPPWVCLLGVCVLLAACQTEVKYERDKQTSAQTKASDASTADASDASSGAKPDWLIGDEEGPKPVKIENCAAGKLCGRNDRLCCEDTEECVDGVACLPVCEAMRCGNSNELCCATGQVCIDGVLCGSPCEAEETVCGAELDLCCGANEVCLTDTCVTPGQICGDDFDCRDEKLYCEGALGRCLPTRDDVMCEGEPQFNKIALLEEWHFPGATVNGQLYENVIAAPMVGDVSGDGVPDVVVPFYAGSTLDDSLLVALSGDSGEVIFTAGGDAAPVSQSSVGLANFDDDPALEIAYMLLSGGLRIIKGDGATELARRTTGGGFVGHGAPAIADLNADGVPDVVLGCHAMNGRDVSDASLDFFDRGDCLFSSTRVERAIPLIADLDGDMEPEITTGGVAYNLDGSELWTIGGDHALSAIADLDMDGTPEVIAVRGGEVMVRAGATGAMLVGPGGSWSDTRIEIPGGGVDEDGGPPTVADFDADGMPEVSTAGQAHYVVYDPDCLPNPPRSGGDCQAEADATPFLRWSTNTQDISSSRTGSSVFDFQGDGAAEVIYNDECFLHVYNGTDGSEALEEVVPNTSRTDLEYPLVVDVDRDGNSEIVVPANRDQALTRDRCDDAYAASFGVPKAELPASFARGTAGIFVFGDPYDRWVPTRPIWNQYTYHVTNVTEAGEIPTVEQDNFTAKGLNNYRQNVQGGTVLNAPNLTVELIVATRCLERSVVLSAEVSNTGSRGVSPGVPVTFVRTDEQQTEVVHMVATSRSLLPGGSERLTVTVEDIPGNRTLEFAVYVDGAAEDSDVSADAGQVAECIEDDNAATGDGFCEELGLE